MNKIEVHQRIKVFELLLIFAVTGVLVFTNWFRPLIGLSLHII